jgi:hypothetical protein
MTMPIEDQLAILKLLSDYNHLVDAGAGEAWADLFVDEGMLDTGMGIVVEGGRDALVDFAQNVPVMVPGTRHIATNPSIQGDANEADAACYLQMWATDENTTNTRLVISGVYQDKLRKVDGNWKFVSRVLHPDRGGPAPELLTR